MEERTCKAKGRRVEKQRAIQCEGGSKHEEGAWRTMQMNITLTTGCHGNQTGSSEVPLSLEGPRSKWSEVRVTVPVTAKECVNYTEGEGTGPTITGSPG